jgi:hypothetical protein
MKVIIIALLVIVVDSHRITKTIAVTMEDISLGWLGSNSNALLVKSIATTIIINLKLPKHFKAPFREQTSRAVRNFKRFVN